MKKKPLILIILFIILVGGLIIYNLIPKEEKELTENDIIAIAEKYATNSKVDIKWLNEQDITKENEEYTCVSIEKLAKEKYIDDNKLAGLNITNYVMIIKDNKTNKLSSTFASDNICRKDTKIKVPKNLCNDIIYDGQSHNLINREKSHVGYSYIDKNEIEASDYSVTLSLNKYYVWEDGSHDDKEIRCSIKKTNGNLMLSSKGTVNNITSSNEVWLTSDISGELLVEISNSNLVSVELDNNNIEANVGKKIIINNTSNNEETTIKFTVVPDLEYSKNYDNASIIYTIGQNKELEVNIPTKEEYCNNLTFNQNVQVLTKEPLEGYEFLNNKKINAGEYQVTASLKYGYIWDDGSLDNKEINCQINKITKDVSIDEFEFKLVKDTLDYIEIDTDVSGEFELINDNIYIDNVKKNSLGYQYFNRLYLNGHQISNNKDITIKFIPEDKINYEEVTTNINIDVINNEFNLVYNLNGGTGCSDVKKIYYNKAYGELCTPTKEGYEFVGWYSDKDNKTNLITEENILEDLNDINIYARFKRTINLTLVQYANGELITNTITGEIFNEENGANLELPNPSNYYDNECGNYEFLGWSSTDKASSSIDYSANREYLFSNDLTLYANYRKKVTFKYNTNGGSKIEPRYEYIYRSASGAVAEPTTWIETVDKIPTKNGYKFLGWYNNQELEINGEALKKGKVANIRFGCNGYEIFAKWRKIDN